MMGFVFQANPVLVEKMLDNIFRCQPSYENDISKSVATMADAVTKTVERIETLVRNSNCGDEGVVEALVDLVTYATGKALQSRNTDRCRCFF